MHKKKIKKFLPFLIIFLIIFILVFYYFSEKVKIINEDILNISLEFLLSNYFNNVTISFFENDNLASIAKNSFKISYTLGIIKNLKNLNFSIQGRLFNESSGFIILIREKNCAENYIKAINASFIEICGKSEKELEHVTEKFLKFLIEKSNIQT